MEHPDSTPPPTRRCSRCGETKPHHDFPKAKGCRDGIRRYCKACQDRALAPGRPQRIRSYRNANPQAALWSSAKNRARIAGLPFNIDQSDIFIPETCPVFGTPLAPLAIGPRSDDTPSLDRIVPSKGYVRGNVVVVSWRANRLKNNSSLDDLRRLLDFYELVLPEDRPHRKNPA